MRRTLKGSLKNLGLTALFRLLGAAGATGRLEVVTAAGSFSLEIVGGTVDDPDSDVVHRVCASLDQASGTFSFEPSEPGETGATLGGGTDLGSFAELCRQRAGGERKQFASDVDVDSLLAEGVTEGDRTSGERIHLLPASAPEHPLEDLLTELEEAAPEELLFAQVGVVTADPRPWRGWIEREWRHRGWELALFGTAHDVPLEDLDALVIYHRLTITRVGHEDDWLELLRRASEPARNVPVVWVGPLGDPFWVARLVEAGASFLLTAPAGDEGEARRRFQETVTRVVARLLRPDARVPERVMHPGSAELVEALLGRSELGEKMGVLLQVASGALRRGAVFSVEETSIRCRAGFGFPMNKNATALPRGVAFLEQVIRSQETLTSVSPDVMGARQLARVLGIERLPSGAVIIPLHGRRGTAGLLVGERRDIPDEEFEELVFLARRIGSALLGP